MNKHELSRRIYNHKMVEKLNKKIKLLGLNNKLDTIEFLNARLIMCILAFFLSLYLFKFGFIIGPILTVVSYYLFEKIVIDDKINRRKEKLETEAMHFFEVLTLSLETGRNLEEALNVTVSSVEGDLSLEFKEAIRETKFGKSLKESLTDMQQNIPSESINNIILALTQANMYGSSIIETMYNQIDYIRDREIQKAKGRISKIPLRVSVISVLFYIPLIMLLILSPVLIEFFG